MLKRDFLKNGLLTMVGALVSPAVLAAAHEEGLLREARATPMADGPFTLPALPYAFNALEPHIDAKTMEIHHDAHHKTYVSKLNEAVAGKPEEKLSLAQLLASASKQPDAIRNNAGGHWNHSFFWQILSPKGGGRPTSALAAAINKDFGSYDKFVEEFTKAATGRFGSGWAWLIHDKKANKLSITSTPNQDNPLMDLPGMQRGTPILGLDVWEHAYYLKHQNKRPDYIKTFWSVVNWGEVSSRYEESRKG
ncbi:superoxide dismutase [Hymenobacter psychrotolerans]|uniref:Superoxide dismutase n=1 Tax=Hymenobacter psychrotolerans DSM 18569 TaxID=1121959 RepID=A0A1M6WW39_9BACT|nr:superoxide dismutase [Hymenobacter psychrotolerans]SHK97765.1 superoxide dismutase, Fe-Mn family [Hymenobacter psychrotolerans DSM 18569]